MSFIHGYPLPLFRFKVSFYTGSGEDAGIGGFFSECTGIEASMEPKVVAEGGRNFGPVQLPGKVTFSTVVLKRGVLAGGALWSWFREVGCGDYRRRCQVEISLLDENSEPVLTWLFRNALPVKFRGGEFNAQKSEVGIEELHFVHEGLSLGE